MALFVMFLFHLYASHRGPRLVLIGDIRPSMNFSTVRVNGVLASDVLELQGGTTFYKVNDGTGELSIFFSGVPEGGLLSIGTHITAMGNLSIGAGDDVRMQAISVERIKSDAPAGEFPGDLRLADITAEQEGARIKVFGKVARVWSPRPDSNAPHKIILTDPSGSLEIVHWFEPELTIVEGDELDVFGTVDVYKGRLQLKVWESDHLRYLKPAAVRNEVPNDVDEFRILD